MKRGWSLIQWWAQISLPTSFCSLRFLYMNSQTTSDPLFSSSSLFWPMLFFHHHYITRLSSQPYVLSVLKFPDLLRHPPHTLIRETASYSSIISNHRLIVCIKGHINPLHQQTISVSPRLDFNSPAYIPSDPTQQFTICKLAILFIYFGWVEFFIKLCTIKIHQGNLVEISVNLICFFFFLFYY